MEIRVKGGMPRMQALKEVMDNDGVTHMAVICAICKAQFTGISGFYGIPSDVIISGHHLVGDAIQLGTKV